MLGLDMRGPEIQLDLNKFCMIDLVNKIKVK